MYKNFNLYKNKILAISLIAIFAMSIVMTFAPTALAQKISAYPVPRVTDAYCAAAPTLIGVGQKLTANCWVEPPPQDAAGNGNIGLTWHGYVVTFTRPDGTKDTFVPTDNSGLYASGQSDPLGGLWFYYTPNMAGNWSMSFTIPAQNMTSTTAQAFVGTAQFAGSTSNTAYFTVTTQAQNAGILNGWPWAPLPNSNVYWTYPINSNNREWAAISGNWYAATTVRPFTEPLVASYQPYGSGISTGHIVWDQQEYLGGIIGGNSGSISYVGYTNNIAAVYQQVIMDGRLYVNKPTVDNKFDCFDLTTGKLLYTATGVIASGIELPGNDYAQATSARGGTATGAVLLTSYGAAPTPYLFSSVAGANNAAGLPTTVWNYYDPLNGALRLQVTNVTVTDYRLVDLTVLAYGQTCLNFNATTDKWDINYAWEWNLTKVVKNDWYTGLVWKTQLNGPGPKDLGPGDGSARTWVFLSSDMSTFVLGASQGDNWAAGFDTATGKWLWNLTLPQSAQMAPEMYNSNSWVIFFPNKNTFSCYDMHTGTLRWSTPNVGTYPMNTRGYTPASSDGTNYYVSLASGEVAALSYATGNIVWTSKAFATSESAANILSSWMPPVVVGGYVYVFLGYSLFYQIDPIQRFSMLVAINATTGAIVWTLNGGIVPEGTANGYLTGLGDFDGNIYVLGKGQTSTSVSAPTTAVTEGTTALIQGNVLDQSPAQPGTPAVSDSSMSEQMDYLHMQNATLLNNPPKEQGVTVTLTAVDPNNNTVTIGTTTTDSAGNYGYNYVPSRTGMYTITATFAGSGSYWPSTSETKLTVTAAAATTTSAPATTTTSSNVTTPIYIVGIALAIVIIIVGAVIVLLQRKRP